MSKICIIYRSKFGNCKELSQQIASDLSQENEVFLREINDISPEDIVKMQPDLLLVGCRIIIGKPDKNVKRFLEELGTHLDEPIPKAAIYYTHGSEWREKYNSLIETIKSYNVCEDVYMEMLEIKMRKFKGPAEPGQESKVESFVDSISHYISS